MLSLISCTSVDELQLVTSSLNSKWKQTNKQTNTRLPADWLRSGYFPQYMYCNYAAAATQMFLSTVLIICVTFPPTGKTWHLKVYSCNIQSKHKNYYYFGYSHPLCDKGCKGCNLTPRRCVGQIIYAGKLNCNFLTLHQSLLVANSCVVPYLWFNINFHILSSQVKQIELCLANIFITQENACVLSCDTVTATD